MKLNSCNVQMILQYEQNLNNFKYDLSRNFLSYLGCINFFNYYVLIDVPVQFHTQ